MANYPRLFLEDGGYVRLYNTVSPYKCYYTTNNTEPNLTSNQLEDFKRIGPFPKDTIFKCKVYNTVDKKFFDTKTIKILDTTDVYLAIVLTKFTDYIILENESKYGKYSEQYDIYGTIYYTVDGSDPITNGKPLATSASYTGTKFTIQTDCDYVVKYCIKYGTLHTDVREYIVNKGAVELKTPTYTVDDKNQIHIVNNSIATTLHTQIKKPNESWKETSTLIYKQPINCVLFVRNWVYTLLDEAYFKTNYSDILTIPGDVPKPNINIDFTNNVIIITSEPYLKIYYAVYNNDTIVKNYTEYTESINLKNNINNTIKAYAIYSIDEEDIKYEGNSEISELTISSSTSLSKPVISATDDIIFINNPNIGGTIYYTLDGTDPTNNSLIYTESFKVGMDLTIKAIVIHDTFASKIERLDYKYEDNNPTKPYIRKTNGENKPLLSDVVKNYVDIIFNMAYEESKVLNSISYVLNHISGLVDYFNIAEENLDRRFSGNSIIIYNEECYSGELDVSQPDIVNAMNNYKVPYWDKGAWNLNYFRNKITTEVTEEELNSYITFPYYNPNTKQNETKHIKITDLYKALRHTNDNVGFDKSDVRSMIYGKYFIIRFIFNNDKKIKLENVSINVQQY